jgi:NADH-quinone oxidoreductase subunit C
MAEESPNYAQKLLVHVQSIIGAKIISSEQIGGEPILHVAGGDIVAVMQALRDDPQCLFKMLLDITAVDYPERGQRFEVAYQLLSVKQNQRIRVKVHTDEATPVPSIVSVFSSAGWYERETWDMYGVIFSGNPDLRRILTDYGFDGHPLRKDFPLTGYVELRYDNEKKKVMYGPVKLPQAYRSFDYLSPWEGMTTVQLPGDEKAAS